MKRRSPIALLALAVATLATGCTTFSDDNVAVRVDDTSYSHDDLDGIMQAIGVPAESLTDLTAVRSIAGTLILAASLDDYLGEIDVEVTDANLDDAVQGLSTDLPTFAAASDDVRDLLARAQANLTVASQLSDPAEAQFEALSDADIYIDPRIGTYDNASGTVIPLG